MVPVENQDAATWLNENNSKFCLPSADEAYKVCKICSTVSCYTVGFFATIAMVVFALEHDTSHAYTAGAGAFVCYVLPIVWFANGKDMGGVYFRAYDYDHSPPLKEEA